MSGLYHGRVPPPAPDRASRSNYTVLAAVGTGSFMAALDSSIVNTVLPVVARALGSSLDGVQWVLTVYLLVVSCLMLGFGRLGDMRGHKRVYLSGFGLFVIASALCGLAPAVPWLVAARALQGVGAAMIIANTAAILTANFPAAQRGRALGLQAALTYLGLTVGPTLGGWLAELSWRWVFLVNVPVGALAFALSVRFIPQDEPAGRGERFDVAGAVLFMAGLVALLVALDEGHRSGWSSAPILGLVATAVVLLAAFVAVEARRAQPMLDLSLFTSRTFSSATAAAILNYVCLYTLSFMIPFYLIEARGYTPARAGTLMSVQSLVMMVTAPAAGILSDRLGARWLSASGMALLAGGMLLAARLGPESGSAAVALALAVCGLGTGTFIAPNNNALMGAAPRDRQGIAAGILATARNAGMMLGVGLAGAVFSTVLAGGTPAPAGRFRAIGAVFVVGAGVALAGALIALAKPGQRPPALA